MAVQSYIGLVNYIENFAQNHLQIRRFKAEFDEQLPNFATETEAYPILFMSPVSNVYSQNDDRFIVKFYCFDVIQKDRSNINNIYSDTSLILNDLKKFIQDGDNYLFNVDSVESNAIPINNALLDYVAGVQMELIIQVDTYSYCEIPLDNGIVIPANGIDIVYSQYLTCETLGQCDTLTDLITDIVLSAGTQNFSGGTILGDTVFNQNVTVSGNTFIQNVTGDTANFTNYFSGGTSLEQVINNLIVGAEDITRVQDGINTYTGGTDNYPTVNIVSSPSFDNILFSGTATGGSIIGSSISATTIYSGGTNLEQIILNVTGGVEDITRVQPGSNINTGGTANAPIVSLVDSPSVNNLTFSGTATGGNVSAVNLSAGTIYSGSTNLATILENYTTDNEFAGHTANTSNPHQVTAAQVGAYTIAQADALLNTKANLSGATFTGTIDAPVILSGGTNLYNIFSTTDANDITRVQPGSNINTGGTANAPIISLVANPSVNNITFSGTATGGNISAGSVSASTLYSGSTNLESIFALVGSEDVTRVQPGTNTTTGGTDNNPTVNVVDSPSFNNITFSGTATGGNISAGSVSATTFYSGSTNLQSIINTVNSRLAEGISTGIISGGSLSINSLDNTKFDIAAGLGYIVDYTVYPQSTQLLSWATQTGLTVTNLATAFATDIAINASGTVLQQSSYTREELRSIIFLGGLDHSNKTNIRNIFKITVPTYGVGSSVKDLTLALGDINLDGNIFSSNGVNLKINKSAGSTFSYGRNYQNNQNDPNVISQSATTQQIFEHAFNNGAGIASFQAQGTDINPNSYDDGSGTLQVVPNNKYTIQRILMFSNSQNVFIQYGQTVYNTKDEAIANLAAASYTNLVGLKTAMVRGYLIVKQGSTTLSTSDTVFVTGDRFGGIGGGSGVAAANYYTTGATVSGTSVIFDRNDLASAYSVNLSALTGNVNVSGNFSATTLFSGSTNLYSIFSTTDTNDITRVQPGTNINTGGTANAPIVNIVDSPSFNNITFSGTATGGNISAGSVSATTFFSGSTPLSTVISSITSNANIWVSGVTGIQSFKANRGGGTEAYGNYSTSIGYGSVAVGTISYAEGFNTSAYTSYAHVEGNSTVAYGDASHAEGYGTAANGTASHAEGSLNKAAGENAHSQGIYTFAKSDNTHAAGSGLSNQFDSQGNFLVAEGESTFVHSTATAVGMGAFGDYAAVLGGLNNKVGTGSTASAIIGGTGNSVSDSIRNSIILGGSNLSATTNDTAYVKHLDVKGNMLSGGTNLYSIFAKTTDIPTVPSSYTYDFMAAVSDETTALSTGTSKVTFYAPRTFTLTGITATLTTSGSTTTTVDVKYNGASVFATPISLTSGVFYSTTATTTSAITKYGKFTVDLTAAGTGSKGIKVILEGTTTA